MSERKRIILLICIMATACLTVGGIAIFLLYRTAFEEERARLVETAQSQARLIEAVAGDSEKLESLPLPGMRKIILFSSSVTVIWTFRARSRFFSGHG
jgi:heme/copper-type cytochrome/quinol oxidase subunit 3